MGAGTYVKVGTSQRVLQIGPVGAVAPAAALVHLIIAEAFLIDAVVIGVAGKAHLAGRVNERLGQRRTLGHPHYAHRPVAAAKLARAVLEPFDPAEIGQYVLPRPARISHLCPVVVIFLLPAHEDHAVNQA